MVRGLIEHSLAPTDLDASFEGNAKKQSTRQVTSCSLVELVGLVVCGKQPSVNGAYQANVGAVAASLIAVYNKLHRVEDSVPALLVGQTAERLAPLVEQVGGLRPEGVPSYRMRILDGNHLAATEHRLPETLHESAGPLPGQTSVVLEPARGLIAGVVCCQDGHALKRSLLDEIVAEVRERDLWLADRNSCVRHFLPSVAARGGYFVIREHANHNPKGRGKSHRRGRIDGGRASQRSIRIEGEAGEGILLRRVVPELDEPTRDGETVITLVTNLPVDEVHARVVAKVYRERWRIEGPPWN